MSGTTLHPNDKEFYKKVLAPRQVKNSLSHNMIGIMTEPETKKLWEQRIGGETWRLPRRQAVFTES